MELACYSFQAREPVASLLFIHGGGAYGGAGYQYLAQDLCGDHHVSVYLLDLRGHGNSEGPRGGAPSANQALQDLNEKHLSILRTAGK
jgi:alpha-beta hydrolase superfamily lysophospholipase